MHEFPEAKLYIYLKSTKFIYCDLKNVNYYLVLQC